MIEFDDFSIDQSFLRLQIVNSTTDQYRLIIPLHSIESIFEKYEVNGFGVNLRSGKSYHSSPEFSTFKNMDTFSIELEESLKKNSF